MQNIKIFNKINEAKYKLVPTLCSIALASAIFPLQGCAAENDDYQNDEVIKETQVDEEYTLQEKIMMGLGCSIPFGLVACFGAILLYEPEYDKKEQDEENKTKKII